MRLRDFVLPARRRLEALYPPAEAASLVGIVCREILDQESYAFLVSPDTELGDSLVGAAEAALSRLEKGEPVQYVLGHCKFYGRRFAVSPAVLIPRPETELLCRMAVDAARRLVNRQEGPRRGARPLRILDLCTGSGCIAWTMALEIPGSRVTAIDISREALEVATGQGFTTAGSFPPEFLEADIFDDASVEKLLSSRGPFDLILSNPPYVLMKEAVSMRSNVMDYEPHSAIFVPDDDYSLFYRRIASIAREFAYTEAAGLVEINEAFGAGVKGIFEAAGFSGVEVVRDFYGKDRIVSFVKRLSE